MVGVLHVARGAAPQRRSRLAPAVTTDDPWTPELIERGRKWAALHTRYADQIEQAPTIEAAALAWWQYWHDTNDDHADPYSEYAVDELLYERIKALHQ